MTRKFNMLGNLRKFVVKRSNSILDGEKAKIYYLHNIHVFIISIYEYLPSIYFTNSGCEVADYSEY